MFLKLQGRDKSPEVFMKTQIAKPTPPAFLTQQIWDGAQEPAPGDAVAASPGPQCDIFH